jgi:hypothetical protein
LVLRGTSNKKLLVETSGYYGAKHDINIIQRVSRKESQRDELNCWQRVSKKHRYKGRNKGSDGNAKEQ